MVGRHSIVSVYAYRSRRLNGRIAHSVRLPSLTPGKSRNRTSAVSAFRAEFHLYDLRVYQDLEEIVSSRPQTRFHHLLRLFEMRLERGNLLKKL
jgi:hypothetical protein